MKHLSSVAVLGAGMAGATAARRLAEAGRPVQVFDKGRGVGGRMATRQHAGLQFDHGAQFMRAHGAAFAARLADWERRAVVAPWAGEGRRVGTPGMTAPVRDLLDGLPVLSATTIVRIRREGTHWYLADGEGAQHGPFGAVAVTFPAPQTGALLEASGFALPGVARATYAPCWSLMLAASTGPVADLVVPPGDGPISLVAADGSKPGRSAGDRLVIHATPAWSRAHLEEPHEAVAAELTRALADLLSGPVAPTYARAHRWRYAQVETALGRACVHEPDLCLGAAGDWCLGARIEAAHDSGLALAEAILAAGA